MIGNGTQSAQNRAHRQDLRWIKEGTRNHAFEVEGIRYVNEYRNPWTGWVIRKEYGNGLASSGRWAIFNRDGVRVGDMHSLTFAKGHAIRLAESLARECWDCGATAGEACRITCTGEMP